MGQTPPSGHSRLPPKNGAAPEVVELRDTMTKLVKMHTERNKRDAAWLDNEQDWRKRDQSVHELLINKISRQSVMVMIGTALLGAMAGWLGFLHTKIDSAEDAMLEDMRELERELRGAHNDDQLRNNGQHFLRGQMEKDIVHNERDIEELQRRVFGRTRAKE